MEIKVVETTKVALLDIQKESVVPKVIAIPGEGVPVMMAKTPEDKKVEEELAALEQQAIENTMEDIKETDPELYKKVKQDSKETKKFDIDNISSRAVGEAFKKAPIDTTSNKEQKPVDKELDGLGDDAYKKYFQNY